MGGRLRGVLRRACIEPEGSTPWARLLVLVGLTGFAVAQPLLAVLGEEPTWFTFRQAGAREIVVFAVAVTVVPPLLLWTVDLLLGWLWRPLGRSYRKVAVAALVALTAMPLLRRAGITAPALQVAVAILGAGGFTVAYANLRAVGLWVRYTAVVAPVALALFLLASPTGDLARAASSGPDGRFHADTDTPSVFFVLLDELPTHSLLAEDGGIDAVRFPHLAALAETSTWYRHHTSSTHRTEQAVPTLLSGKPPRSVPATRVSHPDTLFSLLAPSHEMHVREGPTALCDPRSCQPGEEASRSFRSVLGDLVSDAVDVWQDRVRPGEAPEAELDDFEARPDFVPGELVLRRPAAVADFLATVQPTERSTLWFLHLMYPHQPWTHYPDGSVYDAASFPVDHDNAEGEWVAAVSEQRHLLQLRYTDALVGELLDGLHAAGEFDDALVIVTADHGISFLPGTPRRSPTEGNVDRLAYVPLFIKEPGQSEGRVDDSNTLDLDVVPTIADRLGIELPWQADGRAIGTAEHAERGPVSDFYDFGDDPYSVSLRGTHTLVAGDPAPDAGGRWIGPVDEASPPLGGLLALVGIEPYVGRSLDEVATGADANASATVAAADALRSPPARAAPGFVSGTVDGAAAGDVVLVEVNGAVVTGAPLTEDGTALRFDALLPPDAVGPTDNEIRLARLAGDDVLLLETW